VPRAREANLEVLVWPGVTRAVTPMVTRNGRLRMGVMSIVLAQCVAAKIEARVAPYRVHVVGVSLAVVIFGQ
jgi:hypothetical protein